MAKKPTTADAQLILQLYDLRREAEMRKARAWLAGEFFPQSADDFMKVVSAMGTQENSWFRQVGGYWGIVASFVLHGVLERRTVSAARLQRRDVFDLRQDPSLPQRAARETQRSSCVPHIEKVVTRTKWGRNRLQFMIKRVEGMRQRLAARRAVPSFLLKIAVPCYSAIP